MTEENKKLNTKIESLNIDNEKLSDQIDNLSRELLLAKEKIKDLTEEMLKNLNNSNNMVNNYKNGKINESDNIDFKNTLSSNNAVKFPNKISGYANIKNIDESELNESDYNLSNKKKNSYNDRDSENSEYKNANLFKGSGGMGKINNNHLNYNNASKYNHIQQDKNRLINNNTGDNNSKVNSNNTSNYIPYSKNNFNDSNTESGLNFENRSNSYVTNIRYKLIYLNKIFRFSIIKIFLIYS